MGNHLIAALFWLTAILSVYSYIIYPCVLQLVVPRRKTSATDDRDVPLLSIVICAHNEEGKIKDKIENTLALDYPPAKIEVIIVSDASTDGTNAIVESFDNIKLVTIKEHHGKEYAQSRGIAIAKGEIIVFSDVATTIADGALLAIVAEFRDQTVGAVSSEDKFVSKDGSLAGEGLYVRYEMWLRRLESERAGMVGLSGSFFAARATVCVQWDLSSPRDFNTALNCAKRGLVAVSSSKVIGIYADLQDPSAEFARKVRTVLRGMTGLSRNLEVLNVFKYGAFAFEVVSHKVMRWLVPLFLLCLFALSVLMLGKGWVYEFLFVGQVVFYCTALAAHLIPALLEVSVIRIVFYFVQANLAILVASYRFLSGHRIAKWQPSRR